MYLAYLDESGDPGLLRSPTTYFVLSCVLLHDSKWLRTLDKLIEMRRRLKNRFHISTRADLKGSHFRSGGGAFRALGLPIQQRMGLFKGLLTYEARFLPIKVFSVAIEKADAAAHNYEPRRAAWQFALQRIHTFSNRNHDRAMIFPDEGHAPFIRRLLRQLRRHHTVPRFYGGGTIELKLERIIEDPNDRASHMSYFAQLADWNAYAAHRSSYVAPSSPVPPDAWDQLSGVHLREVNRVTGGPPAIVKWPRSQRP